MNRVDRHVSAVAIAAFVISSAAVATEGTASAAPPTKEECVETYSRAQDHREKNQMSDAKRLFMLCAQQSCPALIQSDCSKFGEELARSVPSLSFSARDAKGNDLPDAQVFIDGLLIASRIDDGKAHDVDPGKHVVRFLRNGKEATVNIVVAVGERSRNISVVIGGDNSAANSGGSFDGARRGGAGADENPSRGSGGPSRPVFPLIIAGIGGAALITGTVLTFVGLGKIPDQCTTSPRQCAAAPDDPVFGDARSAVNMANIGIGVGIVGAVLSVGGLIWYFSSSPSEPASASARASASRSTSPTSSSTKIVPFTNGRDTGGAAVHLSF